MVDTFRSKKMSHWEASNWLRRIYYALDHHDDLRIKFRKDFTDPEKRINATTYGVKHNITGLYEAHDLMGDGKKGIDITINPSRRRYGMIPKVIIHEMLHHIKGEWTEEKTKEYENLIYEALTDRQLWNLMKRVFTR